MKYARMLWNGISGRKVYAWTPENDWEAIFFRYLPRWLVVDNPVAVRDFYEGETGFFAGKYLGSWIVPILAWSFAVFLLLLIFLFITILLRKQWVQRERLSYPIIQIPLEITRESGRSIFRNRLLWIGFAIAAGIDIINGLHYFYPVIPEIPVKKYDLNQYLISKPWNAMGSTPLRFYPFLTGLAFLLPLDLSFSCAFFYMFGKAQRVLGSTTGIHYVRGFSFHGEQGTGALLALVAVALCGSRRHLAHVFASLFRAPGMEEDAREPLPYRGTILGLILCILLLMGFCMRMGMSVWAFMIFLAIYLTVVIGVTRMRAEMGPPIHAIGYVTPQYIIVSFLGTRRVAAGNLTGLSLLNWLSGSSYAAFRTHPMPHQLEAFKIADRVWISNRTMLIVLIIACIVGIQSSLWLYPYVIYKEGVAGASEQILAGGAETYTFLANWLTNPRPSNWTNITVNRASSIHKFDGIIVSFDISRYEVPETLGEFLRRRRLENDLFAKELASLIGVTEDTILNWEKGRTYPSQRKIILLKERLDIDPFELIEFDGAISERQKSILDLITESRPITRREYQELLGLRQQYAQNYLYFLYRLGVLRRTLGKRRRATYFLARDIEY